MIMRQRRFIPSLSQLLAFEAVMRHHSVTAAANELNLTQSTVSRLIKSLEEQLGKELFARQRKRLIPNTEAGAYQADITRGLDIIQRASKQRLLPELLERQKARSQSIVYVMVVVGDSI